MAWEQNDALIKSSRRRERWRFWKNLCLFVVTVEAGVLAILAVKWFLGGSSLFTYANAVALSIGLFFAFGLYASVLLMRREEKRFQLLMAGIFHADAQRMLESMSDHILDDQIVQQYEDIENREKPFEEMCARFDYVMRVYFDFNPAFVQSLYKTENGQKTYFLHKFYKLGIPADVLARMLYQRYATAGLNHHPFVFAKDGKGNALPQVPKRQADLDYLFGRGVFTKMAGLCFCLILLAAVYALVFDRFVPSAQWVFISYGSVFCVWVYAYIRIRKKLPPKRTFKGICVAVAGFFMAAFFMSHMFGPALNRVAGTKTESVYAYHSIKQPCLWVMVNKQSMEQINVCLRQDHYRPLPNRGHIKLVLQESVAGISVLSYEVAGEKYKPLKPR
jgi:hypothetical protein